MSEPARLRIGPWTATPSLNLLERGSRSIRLEPRAMDVLVVLARCDGAVVSIDELIATVWKGVAVGDGSVYLAIRQLRQALGDADEGTRYIETIPKRGYRLTIPVEHVRPDPDAAGAARSAPAPVKRPLRWTARTVVAGVAAVIAYSAAVAFRDDVPPAATHTVAVLPFVNLSSDPGQDPFVDGITVETVNALARVRDLRVTGHMSSFRFERRGDDLKTAGEALGVEHVLHGSVRTAGDRVRITVQLSRARTGANLWSNTYERRLDDIFLIQDDVAKSVAEALQVRLGIGDIGRAPGMTRNVAAYEEYLRALSRNLEWDPESFRFAVAHLQRAVALDPSFSTAWASLNSVYLNGTIIVPDRAQEWREKAAEALDQARALTPDAPDVLLEIGIAEARRFNWLGAARAFDRLQTSYATYGLANQSSAPQGILLLAVGRPRDAIPALERARAIDPLAPAFAGFLSAAYLADGNFAEAFAEIDRGLELEGLDTLLLARGVITALNQGNRDEIDRRIEALPDASPDARVNRRLARFLDAPAGAAAEIRRLASPAGPGEKALLAQWAAFYHQPELSPQLLNAAARQSGHPALLWQPLLRDVRKRPEFRDLVKSLGLVDYWREYGWSGPCRPVRQDDFACE